MTLILVVDDMPALREPIAVCLRGAGYAALAAADGKEALLLAREHNPALILMDVSMPGMDGMTCLAALRAAPSTAQIPVILLTADTDKNTILLAAKLGVKAYLMKSGLSLPELLTRVKQHVRDAVGGAAPTSAAGAPPTA